MPGMGGPGCPPPGAGGMPMSTVPMSVSQPLPSNVLSKQQSNLDQQYMQQSSQIFVFSTQWANNAAKAVMDGNQPSIIGWHESQSETKKHLANVSAKYPNMMKNIMQGQQNRMMAPHMMGPSPKRPKLSQNQPLPGPPMGLGGGSSRGPSPGMGPGPR